MEALQKKNIKTILHSVFEYAMQNDFVNKDYSEFITIEQSDPIIDRNVFSNDEIKLLWNKSREWDVKILLILLYSGMRVNELLKNQKENCNLEERWIYVPESIAKNSSSVRYVPIHDKILPILKDFYNRSSSNLITNKDNYNVTYHNFVSRNFKKINKCFSNEHRFHDTRHTFISKAHEYKLDELTLKKIVGHSPDSITQKVYTHLTVKQMLEEINKIE